MRMVIAPDKFKGSLSAADVAAAIFSGVKRVTDGRMVDRCPVADGGEGTVDALVAATGGRIETRRVTGPLGEPVEAAFGVLGDGTTAVIEMAAAAGLGLVAVGRRNPMETTTFGVGELLREAAGLGVNKIILGIGGSATTDGGIGCALGAGMVIKTKDEGGRMKDERGGVRGRDLPRVVGIERNGVLGGVEIVVACDVDHPLCGARGAARVFGPQKGATGEQVEWLDRELERMARRVEKWDVAQLPGAGAAGGLGFGMVAFFGATLRSGVGIVMEAVGLRERLRGADLCITGEGRLDGQSLAGKAPVGVAGVCRELGVPCVAVVGQRALTDAEARGAGFAAVYEIGEGLSVDERITRARELVRRAGERVGREHLR